MSRLFKYICMLNEFYLRSQRKSYFCYEPKLSKYYKPKTLGPYFYDFEGKINWPGKFDRDGIPEVTTREFLPIIVVQKALGHHSRYCAKKNKRDKYIFLKYCDWLITNLDRNHGIPNTDQGGLSRYSAMVQGQATSVLVRGYKLTKKTDYLEAAKKMIDLLIKDKKHGLVKKYKNIKVLEEWPKSDYKGVFNGWVYAIFGIYDLYLIDKDNQSLTALNDNLDNIAKALKFYDAGFWSYYDLNKHYASPYYHKSHILLLKTLAVNFPDYSRFQEYAEKFSAYYNNKLFVFFSQSIKLFQKIIDPTDPMY